MLETARIAADRWVRAKQAQPGWFLLTSLGACLWWLGFVDLAGRTMRPPDVLGKYTAPFFAFLAAYALAGLPWLWLLAHPRGEDRLRAAVAFAQRRWWLGMPIVVGCAAVIASMAVIRQWSNSPTLSLVVAILLGMAACALVAGRPNATERRLRWQQAAAVTGGVWLATELALQAVALAGALPFANLGGLFIPYGRVYQNAEGLANGVTNRNGWYFPQAPADAAGRKIVVTGGAFVAGLQVPADRTLGAQLDRHLRPSQGAVVGLGVPDYGPELYADPKLIPFTILQYNPKEVIVAFHLADDFQLGAQRSGVVPFYFLDANREPVTGNDEVKLRHDMQHLIIRGYDPVNPVQSFLSHLFTLQMARRLFDPRYVYREYGDRGIPPALISNTASAGAAAPFGRASAVFAASDSADAREAMALAQAQLRALKAELDALGIPLRLATIPYFPAEFFAQPAGRWTFMDGEYDVLKPERELRAFAARSGIPFLGFGEHLRRVGATPSDIQSLFFRNGAGRFTEAGHTQFARAVAACFYGVGGPCPAE